MGVYSTEELSFAHRKYCQLQRLLIMHHHSATCSNQHSSCQNARAIPVRVRSKGWATEGTVLANSVYYSVMVTRASRANLM